MDYLYNSFFGAAEEEEDDRTTSGMIEVYTKSLEGFEVVRTRDVFDQPLTSSEESDDEFSSIPDGKPEEKNSGESTSVDTEVADSHKTGVDSAATESTEPATTDCDGTDGEPATHGIIKGLTTSCIVS